MTPSPIPSPSRLPFPNPVAPAVQGQFLSIKNMIRFLRTFLTVTFAVMFMAGCASKKLESGGAYAPTDSTGAATAAPDLPLFTVDSAYRIAYNTVDSIFTIEKDNRDLLWKMNPEIKHTLDRIRPQAWEANVKFHTARNAYIANPVPANLAVLQQILATMQQLVATATAVLPKGSV